MAAARGQNRQREFSVCLALLGWLALTSPALGQTTLHGILRDPNGLVAPDIPVIVEHEITGHRWDTTSTPIGRYFFADLPPGPYRITITVRPFKPVVANVIIRPQHQIGLDISLSFQGDETVTVESQPTLPQANADGSLGATFSGHVVEALPLTNGRTLQSFLSLVPGVVVTESVGNLAQYTTTGQRRHSNRTNIDGISGDLAVAVSSLPGIDESETGVLPAFATSGGTQTLVPVAAIEEIQIRTGGTTPEHAQTPGAQTSIVTRAGGSHLTAALFADARPHQLGATDWFDNATSAPDRRIRYWNTGASLGGPLFPKRMFYFTAWERQEIARSVSGTLAVPGEALRNSAPVNLRPVLDAFPMPTGPQGPDGLAEAAFQYPSVSRLNTLSARVDAHLSSRNRLFARVNAGESAGDFLTLDQPNSSYRHAESTSTKTLTTGWSSFFASVGHDLRANVSEHQGAIIGEPAPFGGARQLPLSLIVPSNRSQEDVWARVTLFPGSSGFLISGRTGGGFQQQVQVVDTWSFVLGRHEWRLGFDFRQLTSASEPTPDRYTYRFASLEDFLRENGRVTLEHVEKPRTRRRSWSVFAQDLFRVSPRLSLSYGLRYNISPAPTSRTGQTPLLVQYESLPKDDPIELADVRFHPTGTSLWETSWTDIAPHIGAAYQLGTKAGRETTLRAAFDVVFDDVTTPGMSAFGEGYPYVSSLTTSLSVLPVAPGRLDVSLPAPLSPDDIGSNYYAFPRRLRSPRTHNWQVSLDQSLGRSRRLGLAYVGATGRDLIYWHQEGVGDPRQDLHLNLFSNIVRSDYHALVAEFVQRSSRGLQGRVAYTWSHAIDTDSGESIVANPPLRLVSPESNRGSADFDRRHLLHLSATYQIPALSVPKALQPCLRDWQFDIAAVAQSGAPVSIQTLRAWGGDSYRLRPDVRPGVPMWIADPLSPTGWRINGNAFEVPDEQRQGTLGRNTLRGSPLRQVDMSLSRLIRLGARVGVHLRLDAFNVFNIPNFAAPFNDFRPPDLPQTPGFGVPVSSYAYALGTGTLTGGGLVPIQQKGGGRSIQLGLRVTY